MRTVTRLAVAGVLMTCVWSGTAVSATPGFVGKVSTLGALARRMTGVSWHAGCPVPLAQLRLLTLTFWGFDGRVHTGRLVVNQDVAEPVLSVFARLYRVRFPIRRMRLVDDYGGSRLPLDRGRQHVGLQLPRGDRLHTLVRARLRARDRRRPDREPLRLGRADVPLRKPALSRPLTPGSRNGISRRSPRRGVQVDRLGLGRKLVGERARLPAFLGQRPLTAVG